MTAELIVRRDDALGAFADGPDRARVLVFAADTGGCQPGGTWDWKDAPLVTAGASCPSRTRSWLPRLWLPRLWLLSDSAR